MCIRDRAEFERVGPGGGVVRVKNDFTMSRSEAAEKFGYRTVLTNYRMVCERTTYRDVLRELRKLRGEVMEFYHEHELDPLIRWLEGSGRLDEAVTVVVETQLILPVFLAGRKLSHWAYKYVRCERPDALDGRDGGLAAAAIDAFWSDLMQ